MTNLSTTFLQDLAHPQPIRCDCGEVVEILRRFDRDGELVEEVVICGECDG